MGHGSAEDFLELEQDSCRKMHLKAFASVYDFSVREALGREGLITLEGQEALDQLGSRLGLEAEDTTKIFQGAEVFEVSWARLCRTF